MPSTGWIQMTFFWNVCGIREHLQNHLQTNNCTIKFVFKGRIIPFLFHSFETNQVYLNNSFKGINHFFCFVYATIFIPLWFVCGTMFLPLWFVCDSFVVQCSYLSDSFGIRFSSLFCASSLRLRFFYGTNLVRLKFSNYWQ